MSEVLIKERSEKGPQKNGIPKRAYPFSKLRQQFTPEHQAFLVCLSLHIVLPQLPLGLEYWINNFEASPKSVTLTAAIYAVSIGASSRNAAMLAFGILVSIIYSAIYGVLMTNAAPPIMSTLCAFLTINLITLFHAIERYNRHVVEHEPFLFFGRRMK